MILYYKIAKEGKYKKDDDGENYIDCVLAISKEYISTVKDEAERKSEAEKFKPWLCEHLEIFPIWVSTITKEEYDAFD